MTTKRFLIVLTFIVSDLTALGAPAALAGSSDDAYQTAKGGSSCGHRAASRRAGGR